MFARVEIYDPAEQLLDVADSTPIKALNALEAERLDETVASQLPNCK